MQNNINNYEPRHQTKINLKTLEEMQNRYKAKFLILVHYPNGKHHIFIVNETERQLLKRVKSICFNKRDRISYLNVYEIYENIDNYLMHYGEFTFKSQPTTEETTRELLKEIKALQPSLTEAEILLKATHQYLSVLKAQKELKKWLINKEMLIYKSH